jgi:hypothetical protein
MVLEKKFASTIHEQDGLALIKKARNHINKDELLTSLEKLKISVDYIQSLFKVSNNELQ